MRYFISVGEASGDIHAAALINAIKELDADARFCFLGGDLMAEQAECSPFIHYREMAFMGFSEVLRHLPQVLGNLKKAKKAIADFNPEALILVDYPSFNLKLAKYAHHLGIPVFYYISPKVWAWKEYRVKDIKRYVTRLFSILPFEVDFYRRHNYDIEYVGNPSVEEVENRRICLPEKSEFLSEHSLEARPMIALVPGSRRGEIRNNLPIMEQVAKKYPQFQPVVAGAPGIEPEFYGQYTENKVIFNSTFSLMHYADIALVTSGTATLECALLNTPQVVCYRANGSKFSYNLFKHILKVKYVSLPNLIADKDIIPEMLLHHCNIEEVAAEVAKILPGTTGRQKQIAGYTAMRDRLGSSNAAKTTASHIYDILKIGK